MKSTDYAEPSPACELLRRYLRQIYTIDQRVPFDIENDCMPIVPPRFLSARGVSRALGVPISQVIAAIHRGVISPSASTSRQLLITEAQLETLRRHLIETK